MAALAPSACGKDREAPTPVRRHRWPPELFADDRKAVEKFHKNKDVFQKMHATGTASVPHMQRSRMPEVEVKGRGREVEANEEAKKDVKPLQTPETPAQQQGEDLTTWAANRGIARLAGESPERQARLRMAWRGRHGLERMGRVRNGVAWKGRHS